MFQLPPKMPVKAPDLPQAEQSLQGQGKTILKLYAEFEATAKGLIPITHKSWWDYPTKKEPKQDKDKEEEKKQRKIIVEEDEVL